MRKSGVQGRSLARLAGSTVLFSAVVALVGCGSDHTATVTANVKLTSNAVTARRVMDRFESLTLPFNLDVPRVLGNTEGSASAAQLTSLKYFFTSINICQSLETSGTAWNNPQGCIEIYTGPTDATLNPNTGGGAAMDYAAAATYAAAHSTGYVDLMDATSRATLTSAGGAAKAGSYSWGYIGWAYPIKVTATVPTNNPNGSAATLYTKAGTTTNRTANGYTAGFTSVTGSMATGSPEEAVVTLPNGGTWFKFQNPFVITDSDSSIAVDLTFNPENLVRGFAVNSGGTNSTPSNLNYYDQGASSPVGTSNAISVPFLDMTPVPRRGTEQTVVETYTTTGSFTGGTTDTFTLRLELYYNSADTAKSIYGATLRVVPNSTTLWSTDVQKIAFISTSGTTLSFNDYANNPIIKDFTRQTSVSGTTTASLPCAGGSAPSSTGFNPQGCPAGGALGVTFQLSSVKILN